MSNAHVTVGDIRNEQRLVELLQRHYVVQPHLLQSLVTRFGELAQATKASASESAMLLNVPGRIEVLGKHTDYAGGVSLTCASRLSIVSLVTCHPSPSLIVTDAVRGIHIELPYVDPMPIEYQSWSTYIVTVLKRLIRHFGMPSTGIAITLASNLPSASGMSSSSGLIITIALAILGKGGLPGGGEEGFTFSRARFSGFAGALESGADFEKYAGDAGVGTKGGSQDHAAILCSEASQLGMYSYFPVKKETMVLLPEDVNFVVGSSGVKARKTGNAKRAYNRASIRAAHVVSAWNIAQQAEARNMGEMVLSPDFSRESLKEILAMNGENDGLWNRFLQFDRECHIIIPGALGALSSQNWDAFGRFTDESQKMADTWLQNQVEETNDLVFLAREAGALGASAFGAGFGGAVWALVKQDNTEQFMTQWIHSFAKRYPARMSNAQFFVDLPSHGVFVFGAPYFRFQPE